MFSFFRRRREQAEARNAKAAVFKTVLAEFERGRGNPIEAALVLLSVEGNQDALTRFLIAFGSNDIHSINKGSSRIDDIAMTEGPDGTPFVAVFSSRERAVAATVGWGPFDTCSTISPLELVFALNEGFGVALNPEDEHLSWRFTPEQVSNLRTLFEGSFSFVPGGIYSVWSSSAYRAVKLLKTDNVGVHIRLYANSWSERPSTIDPSILTLCSSEGDSIRPAGHLPFTKRSFLAMGPKIAATGDVDDDELDGYKIWEEAKGGYFGA